MRSPHRTNRPYQVFGQCRPAVLPTRRSVRVGAGKRTGKRSVSAPLYKGAMSWTRKPLADGCLSGPQCALCKWRRLGDLLRPLTTKEWSQVFRDGQQAA